MELLGQTTIYDDLPVAVIVVGLVWALVVVVISFMKSKPGFGTIGIFVGPFAFVAAVRIAKPDSWWAKKYYPPGGYKMRLAMERFEGIPRAPSL